MPVRNKTRKPDSSPLLAALVQKEVLGLFALAIVALFFYVWFLNHQESRAEKYFADMRTSNPVKYLNEVKQVSGFEDFLREYARIKGYDTFKPKTPEFLLGRWSITPVAKRVSDSYESISCMNPLLIENGRITYPGENHPRTGLTFRLNGPLLTVRQPGQPEEIIRIVSSGVFLHHLELVLPGETKTSYGYRCK